MKNILPILTAGTLFAAVLSAPAYAQGTGGGTSGGQGGGTAPGQAPSAPTAPGQGQSPSAPTAPGQNSPTAPTTPNPNTAPQGGAQTTNPTNQGNGQSTHQNGAANGAAGSQSGTPTANASPDFDVTRSVTASIASSTAFQNANRFLASDRARAGEAAAEREPSITASASATGYDQATVIRLGGGPGVVALQSHSEQLTLGVSQRVDLTGQIRAAVSQAQLQTLADTFTLAHIAQDRALEAKMGFYNYLRATHQVQVAQAQLRSTQNQRSIAERLYRGGIGQKIDFLRAETNVATAQGDLTRARNNADVSRAQFNNLVGRPLNAPLNAADVPGVTVGEDTGGTARVPVGSATFTPFTVPDADVSIDPDAVTRLAQSRRPDVLQNALLVRVNETGVKLARAGLEPSLSFSAAGNYFPSTSLQTPRQRVAAITASLIIPLYDGGVTRDRVRDARSRTETAQANYESSKTDAALAVRQAYLNLSTAARQIAAANAALAQAVAARELAQIRYEGQVGLFLEVTDAQAALVRAQNAQVDAVYDYLVARARFENASGEPVPYQ